MNSVYHILNGDALLEQLPDSIIGERIVAREALVDGDVHADTLEELFRVRDHFMSESYPGYIEGEYYQKSVPEFNKIQSVPKGAEVNLWFEDDLFCQVNLWFVCHLLNESEHSYSVWLIRPPIHTQYGFGGIPPRKLPELLDKKISISGNEIALLSQLWQAYQKDDLKALQTISLSLTKLPFVQKAVEVQIDRVENNTPEKIISEIIEELDTNKFGPVFGEFCKRTPQYGFGDLQVKRVFDNLLPKI